MYFVFYHPLKHKLRTNSLSDREALPYLIIAAFLFSLASYSSGESLLNAHDFVSMCLSVIIVIGGTYYVYVQNGGREGFNLIQKYLVLGWVVGIRICLVSIPGLIVYVVVRLKLRTSDINMLDVVWFALFKLIYYHRLGRHIRDTKAPAIVDGRH